MRVGFIQSAEGLVRTKGISLSKQERILQKTAFSLRLHHWLSLVFGLPAHTADFEFARLHNCTSQFLIINLFLYTSYWFCFSGEPWLIYRFLVILCPPNHSSSFNSIYVAEVFLVLHMNQALHWTWLPGWDKSLHSVPFCPWFPSLLVYPSPLWIARSLRSGASLWRTSSTELWIDNRVNAHQYW